MAAQEAVLVVGVACLAVGVWRDVRESERSGGVGLWGVFRPVTRRGLRRGLPFYLVGAAAIVTVAVWGSP